MGLGLSRIGFYTARGIHPAPMARPLSRSLRDWGCRTLDFIRLGGIHPALMVWLPSKGLRDLEWLILAFVV